MPHVANTPGMSRSCLFQVLETLPAAAYTCDPDGLITYCNQNAIDLWGRAPRLNDPSERFSGAYKLLTADGRPIPHDQSWMARTLVERVAYNGQEIVIQQPNGTLRHALIHVNPILDEQGRLVGASNVLIDITDGRRFDDKPGPLADLDAPPGPPDRPLFLNALRRSIEGGAMELYYQPSIELATLEVVGVEALVRWRHPTRGLISPADFLPLAEAHGLMRKLDLWVFETAVAHRNRWLEAGLDLDVAVNLSAESLLDTEFVDAIVGMFDDHVRFPSGLTVELSERILMRDADRTRVALDRLRYLGIRVSLDDFGTGYSSLAHLKRLEVDEIKLDVNFVRELPRSRVDAGIAEAIIDLGASLGLIVTAEGVERPQTLEWLAARGCDRAQGYLFSPALPPDELPRWAAARVAAEAV